MSMTLFMKSLLSKIAAIGFFLLIVFNANAQENMKISGTITDSLTHEPIPFATVALLNHQTKVAVKATQTDSSGFFAFENVPGGVFTLRMTYVGYNDVFKDNILIRSATRDV